MAVLIAAGGMSFTTFVGALSSHSTLVLLVATAVTGYAFATFGQLGPIASTIALNSFVAFILFSSQPLTPGAAAVDSALVLGGGLTQALLLVVVWPTARLGAERSALAEVYRKLATYARTIAEGSPSLPPTTPFATARQVLDDPQPFTRAADRARFGRLLEDSEIIRRRLGGLAALIGAGATMAARDSIRAAAVRLDRVAAILTGARADADPSASSPQPDDCGLPGLRDVADHTSDAIEAATMLSSGRLPRLGLLSKARPGPYVTNHIDWLARDSLRFAVVLTIAMALGRHFAASRGYWIPLTAALVLKPDFQTTFVRGFSRIAGTLAGAVVATLFIMLIDQSPPLATTGILMTAAGAYLTFNPNYALFTVAITSFVTIVLHQRGLSGTATVEARLLDTLTGGALAMIGYLLLPSWEHQRTRALLADLLDAQRRLAGAILRAYASPADDGRKSIESARTRIWRVRTAVEASIERTTHEPHLSHTIGAARALRILAASQRLGLANLALETALETQPRASLPGLESFAAALDRELSELAEALRESRRARLDGTLAAAAAHIDQQAQADPDPGRRFLGERLRAYAQAAARVARLVGIQTSLTSVV